MKKKYFVKESHISMSVLFILIYALIMFVIILMADVYSESFIYVVIFSGAVTFIWLLLVIELSKMGLYFDGGNIYYRIFTKRNINVSEIFGIKVTKALNCSSKIGFYPLKDFRGNYLYEAIFVSKVDNSMFVFNRGDYFFKKKYKQYYMFETIYDEEMINRLIAINPNIVIMKED